MFTQYQQVGGFLAFIFPKTSITRTFRTLLVSSGVDGIFLSPLGSATMSISL